MANVKETALPNTGQTSNPTEKKIKDFPTEKHEKRGTGREIMMKP